MKRQVHRIACCQNTLCPANPSPDSIALTCIADNQNVFLASNWLWMQAPSDMSTDRDALLALFRSTDGANWARKGNWGIDERLWMWYGLEVSSSSLDGLQGARSSRLIALFSLPFFLRETTVWMRTFSAQLSVEFICEMYTVDLSSKRESFQHK